MRIAVLANSFPPPTTGGAARIAALQVEALRREGHDVRVWAPSLITTTRSAGSLFQRPMLRTVSEKETSATIALESEEIVRFSFPDFARMNPVGRFWFHLVTDAQPRVDLVNDIVAWKPDELRTHNLMGCGVATARAIQSHGIRWMHTLHDIQLTDPSGQETEAWSNTFIAKAWRGFWSWRRRASFGVPDALVSPTQWLMEWHHSHGFRGTEEMVAPNPMPEVEMHDRELKIPATVLYVGRLSRDKGFDLFLDVVKQLPPTLVDQITVIGSGPMAAHAKRFTDSRMDLIGNVPPETVQQIMAQADVLIAPSRLLENQQTILLEAMVAGTPVVATDTGGTRETLEGTDCPVVDAGRLHEEVLALLSNGERWKVISQKQQKKARG